MSLSESIAARLPPSDKRGWPWQPPQNSEAIISRHDRLWPRITVVTPSYNQGQFLEETLRSVLLQEYPNLEYIVIDGGSTDGSLAILHKYAPFLTSWTSEPDNGQANAINKGFTRSSGTIMGWLNSDDLLMPNALFQIAAAFLNDSRTNVVCGFRKVIDAESRFRRNWIQDLPTAYYLNTYCPIAQETVYWRREVWERLGSLDETKHFALDYEYWMRMLSAGYQFCQLPEYLGLFREHETSKTSTLHDVSARDMEAIFEKYVSPKQSRWLINGRANLALGVAWVGRYQFLQSLGTTHLFDSARRALTILQTFNWPGLAAFFYWLYYFGIYRAAAQARGFGKLLAELMALGVAALKTISWLFRVMYARLLRHQPLRELDADRILAWAGGLLRFSDLFEPADGLFAGENWFALEYHERFVFRWANNDAQIVVTAPTGKQKQLVLTIEPGISVPKLPLTITATAQNGQILAEFSIERRETIPINLSINPGQSEIITLHANQTALPIASDPRLLTFRVSKLVWAAEEVHPQ